MTIQISNGAGRAKKKKRNYTKVVGQGSDGKEVEFSAESITYISFRHGLKVSRTQTNKTQLNRFFWRNKSEILPEKWVVFKVLRFWPFMIIFIEACIFTAALGSLLSPKNCTRRKTPREFFPPGT